MTRASCRTRALLTAALLCAGALTACGSHDDSGSVAGDYRLSGGPSPGVDRPLSGTVWAFAGEVSWDQASTSTPVAHATADADGHFSLRLPGGEFTLLGAQGTGLDDLVAHGCGSPDVVDVDPSTSQTVHLVCSIP